jgi:hypothetical protein
LVEAPVDPEVSVFEPEVADVETFVRAVSSGTDDAEEAIAVVGIPRAKTPRLGVVPQETRARVKEPWIEASASAMAQDPAAAPFLLEEPKHVALDLRSRWARPARHGSAPWSSVD